jgi:hypothetical protein
MSMAYGSITDKRKRGGGANSTHTGQDSYKIKDKILKTLSSR